MTELKVEASYANNFKLLVFESIILRAGGFPGGPVVMTPGLSMPRGLGSIPGQETKIPQVTRQQTNKQTLQGQMKTQIKQRVII